MPLLQLRASFSLTDQSHENMGNMMLIPGSHRSHVPLPQDKRREVAVSPIQHNVLCKAGTMLLFHNGVWHSPMPNDEDFDRYNMHYIYSPPWFRRADRFQTDPAVLAGDAAAAPRAHGRLRKTRRAFRRRRSGDPLRGVSDAARHLHHRRSAGRSHAH